LKVRFKNESFIYHASLALQWTPLLLVVSMFACENTQCGPRLSKHNVMGSNPPQKSLVMFRESIQP